MALKPPLTYEQQVERLKSHGIQIDDDSKAILVLKRIGYYRFTGYALQFRKSPSDSDCIDGITFNQILRIYDFDESLRCTLRQYLEITEVYYKSLISNGFSLIKCTEPPYDQHYNENNYFDRKGYNEVMDSLKNEGKLYYRDSQILKHHKKKYHGKMPLWVMLELLSFSNTSKLYNAMYDSDKQAIANKIGISANTLTSHLHCLSVLRNKCAHGARLYNTEMAPPVHMSETYKKRHPEVRNDSLFAYILTLHKRLPNRMIKQQFYDDICSLAERFNEYIDMNLIGFPENYKDLLAHNI